MGIAIQKDEPRNLGFYGDICRYTESNEAEYGRNNAHSYQRQLPLNGKRNYKRCEKCGSRLNKGGEFLGNASVDLVAIGDDLGCHGPIILLVEMPDFQA